MLFKTFFGDCIYFYVYVCTCTTYMLCPQKPEEGVRPLALNLQRVVSFHVGAGIKSRLSGREIRVFNCWASSPAPCDAFYKIKDLLKCSSYIWLILFSKDDSSHCSCPIGLQVTSLCPREVVSFFSSFWWWVNVLVTVLSCPETVGD